jgi:F-type H+-transporting ATPase subunit a
MKIKPIKFVYLLFILFGLVCFVPSKVHASELSDDATTIKPKEIIFEHIRDAYWWHIITIHDRHISLYLPVIVYSSNSGFHVFSSARIDHGNRYKGFYISNSEKYAGKIVESGEGGQEIRPIDLSLTKTAAALILNSILMVVLFLSIARWYKKRPKYAVPGGFVGMMEVVIMMIEEDVIRLCVGKDYARYSPYLLTAFFFILINNLMGLIPFFPGGANVTGNIAITTVLALCTFTAVNLFGNKGYWKEIFWPDVPLMLKFPVPLMPVIEFFGIFIKAFALAIRLFANITAGHALLIAITCLIFMTAKSGVVMHTGMTVFSIFIAMFINLLEILVSFLQAYIFTMLSAVFIGLSRPEHHAKAKQFKELKK